LLGFEKALKTIAFEFSLSLDFCLEGCFLIEKRRSKLSGSGSHSYLKFFTWDALFQPKNARLSVFSN